MNNALGNLLRDRRQERGITLTDLAARLGLTKSYLSMLESGRRSPADDQFEAMARALEIPADILRVAAGCLPADVAMAVPERAEKIVAAIRREDATARVSLPCHLSPKLLGLVQRSVRTDGPAGSVQPYPEALRIGKNSAAYRAHSYHTKVPPQAIEKLIRHHTSEGQVVVDPFCGSGMTGVASILTGRHAVLSDLSPAAVHIARNYTTPCAPEQFKKAVERVGERVRPTMSWLYETGSPATSSRVEYTVWSDVFQCPGCGAEIVYWEGARDKQTGAVTELVRCGSCRHAVEKRALRWVGERPVETNAKSPTGRGAHAPTNAEFELIRRAAGSEILYWIPVVPFDSAREMWRASHSALGIKSAADFYTKRNLHALAALRDAIQKEPDERIRAALLFAFTGIVNRASKRYQWNVKRPTNVMTGTLYVSSLRYEWNVWSLFERKAGDVTRYFEYLGRPVGNAEAIQASATTLTHLPDQCADYVFMDPPFGSNIFYADSSLLWESWLGTLTDDREEIVVNKHRSPGEGGKTLPDYQQLMTRSFREVARVLKPSAFATLQFNNSSAEVWCAIQDALSDAGLEVRHAIGLDKIHPSIKGVKGRQAKEDIASLDALIELRRKSSSARSEPHNVSPEQDVRQVLMGFANAQRTPFTTDEAFSYLVRLSLSEGSSLAGVSIQTIKSVCGDLFQPEGNRWRDPQWSLAVSVGLGVGYVPVGSPYGCVIESLVATDDEVLALLDPARPAPVSGGEAPRVVSGQRNTAFYNAHSYHTKLPPEAVATFLKHFTRPGDVVLDPFCGTGMTGVAAQLTGRRAILSDLSVAAVHLAYNHTRPCDSTELTETFSDVCRDLESEFRDLYACVDGKGQGYIQYTLWSRDAICPCCTHRFSIWDSIDRKTGRMPLKLTCPNCGRESSKQSLKYVDNRPVLVNYKRPNGERCERTPSVADDALVKQFLNSPLGSWHPEVAVDSTREMYIRSALHLQGIRTIADFYTPRNLLALSRLWERIQRVKSDRVRSALTFAFTNTAWHGTRMRRFNARGGQRPLTGTLYIPQISSEANVLEVMKNKIRQLRSYYDALGQGGEPSPAVRLGSATNLRGIPDASIDYVFTDPPFGSNIFYADCNLIWESWLGGLTRQDEEAVVNRSRDPAKGGKTVGDYQGLMTDSMREIHRVLKLDAWATLVFHSTDPAVWRAIQTAAESAGFQIANASALDRKQHSPKGYKGRKGQEDVAHFDVIMTMRKVSKPNARRRNRRDDARQLVLEAFQALPHAGRTLQRVHSEVIQRLVREGKDLGAVSFNDVRTHMPSARSRTREKSGVQASP